MSSSTFIDSTEDKDDQLIIIVNADGTITVDPETLQKLIANQYGGNLSVVRVGDNVSPDNSQEDGDGDGGGPHVNLTVEGYYSEPTEPEILQSDGADASSEVVDPFSQMEPEHIARLESVLQSEQAKEILGTNLVEDNNLNSVLDILEGKDEVSPSAVHNDHSYTSAIPAYQQPQVQVQNQPVQVTQQSHHRPLTRGGRSRGRGRGLMTRGGRGGNAVVHQVVVSASSPVSQSPVKVIQASPQKTFVVASPSHPRVIAQTINNEEEQTPTVVHRRTILTKLPQSSPQLKQQTLHQALHSSSPSISIAQDTGGTQTIITSTPIVIQRKVPITRGGRGGRGIRGGRSRKPNIASGDEVSAALQAMELTPPQSQPTQSPIVASPTKQQSTPQLLVEQEATVKKKPTMPTVIIRKIGSKSEIISTSGKSNKVRLHSEENIPEQYAIIQPQQQPQGNKTVKQVLVPKPVETTTPTRVTAKELVASEDPSSKKKKEKKAILASPPAEALGPELFSTPDIIRRVSTDKPADGLAPLTPTQVEPKVQVQPTHPPFKPIINCDEMTPESLLDSIHAEVAAKDDSRLIAEALLLDDLTNDDSQSMSYPGKEKPDPARTTSAVTSQPQQQIQQSQTQNQASLDAHTPRIRKLPPIELPTTRSASKKAAASQQPNSIQQQQQQSRNAHAQREKRQQVAAAVSEKRHSTEVKKVTEREKKVPIKEDFVSDFEDEEAETDEESWNSEDDPDRLWCICKKPHNNRFMICCDGCEEWFHGKCVGITKALGQQMESKGIEWSCPNCTQAKAQNNKKVLETSKFATTAPSAKLSSGQQTISSLECIVCKKPAKVDSNYCTDLCVRKHALTMLALLKKETDGLQLNSRVVVYEKKSGKLLAGNAAPTVQILADWLLEHQTYEIAKPSVLPPNKFYKKPTQTQASPPEAAQQKQQTPYKQEQQQESTTPKVQQLAATKQQAKQAQPKATNQLKQQQQPEVKQLQQQSLTQAKQQPTQIKQTQQQPSQIQAKQQQSAKQLQPARPSVIKQSGNEKGGNLKQAVLTQKITASGTKEIGFAPKPSTTNKLQIIQAQPMAVQQPASKAKAKEEDDGKSKKSAAKAIAQSPTEASTKRHSVDGKKPLERLPSKEDKRRDSVSSTKDKDEKKKEEKKKRKDSTSETIKPSEETTPAPSTPSVEPVRANVKRTLQDVLIQRVKQDDSLNIPNDEIQELSNLIEEEMFALFKDTGTKYKSKYRSLIFNIKDPKNLTLYRKIVEKSISPTQLVRLSPEELASQELAQWREKEAKHQLEIIKKNELDLIHQAKTVVLKSRKGEEVIETKAINISELESALNRTADDYDLEKSNNSDTKEEEKSPEKKNDKKKEEHSSRSSDRKKKKEDKNRMDRSRSRRRSRSRSRDRDKKRKEKEDKPKEKDKLDDKAEETLKEIEEVISQHISIPPPPPSQPDSDLSDREPSSTVNISTPPLEEEKSPVWRGILNMSEVTKLYTSAYEVSGSCEDLGEELSDQLDCVGRIQPDSVWEYVSRMKKAGTKDIIVIRFHSDAEEEKMNYLSLYSYLNSRNRMAVIGQVSKTVKDFYVLPLASHSPIPQVLLPLDGPGFDDYRTHLLLGIIIRTKKGSTSSLAVSSRSKKSSALVSSSSNRLERSYTPPLPADGGTPPTTPPPLPPFSKPYSHPPGLTPPLPDDDEPYSPGEDDLYSPEDNQAEAILVNPEIQRNLEEVNRMIEQKRQQIQSIAQAAAGTQGPVPMDEESPYSPSSSFTPPRQGSEAIPFLDTNDIKLPPNLQDILASIKGTPAMDVKSDPIVKAYTSQAFYEEEEEEEEELKEEEKDVKSERTSRDPRQRPDPPKPKSALSQLSDSELIRKAAEMESEEKKEFKQPAYFYPAPPPVAVAVAPQPIYPLAPTHYKYPPAPAPPPPPPVVDKERKRKDKFKERRPLPPPVAHPPRRKWDSGHHNRGMMQHRPPIRGNRPPRFRGGFDRGRGGFRGGGGGFRPPRGSGGPPSRFRGTHGRDRNVQSEWDEEIRNFEQRKARERKRRASRSPSPRRRSLSPPRRRSRRASSNSS